MLKSLSLPGPPSLEKKFFGNLLEASGALLCKKCGKNISLDLKLIRKIANRSVSDEFLSDFASKANDLFPKYGVNTCFQMVQQLGQRKHETKCIQPLKRF